MPNDMWTILPTYSHSKIRVKKGYVYKGLVKMVYWILGWFRVESLCNYCCCCVLKPLLSDIMVDFIIWWFQLQVATYAGNKMRSKGMDDKFVSYIKHLHPLVNLFAVDVFSDVTEWASQTWITPEDEENDPETFPEEMKITCKVLAVHVFTFTVHPVNKVVTCMQYLPGISCAQVSWSLGFSSISLHLLLPLIVLHVIWSPTMAY